MVGFGAKPSILAGLIPRSRLRLARPDLASHDLLAGRVGPMLLMGCGMGLAFVPLTTASLAGVAPEDSGAASAMVNVAQQVGGALGLAALVSVYGHAARSARSSSLAVSPLARAHDILAHGVAASFATAAVFDTLAIFVVIVAVRLGTTAVKARAR